MRITFLCDSCRSELTVASHFAGRAILCPRCRRKTRIPATNAASDVESQPSDARVREASNAFVKLCANFAPNPFAFSVRLETFASSDGEAAETASDVETSASKTPSVHELIATLLDEDNR